MQNCFSHSPTCKVEPKVKCPITDGSQTRSHSIAFAYLNAICTISYQTRGAGLVPNMPQAVRGPGQNTESYPKLQPYKQNALCSWRPKLQTYKEDILCRWRSPCSTIHLKTHAGIPRFLLDVTAVAPPPPLPPPPLVVKNVAVDQFVKPHISRTTHYILHTSMDRYVKVLS